MRFRAEAAAALRGWDPGGELVSIYRGDDGGWYRLKTCCRQNLLRIEIGRYFQESLAESTADLIRDQRRKLR